MTIIFLSVKISEISWFLVKKLQFEAQTPHITDSAEGDEDTDGLDEVEVEDQAESGLLYANQTETETETETEDENGGKLKGLEHSYLMLRLLWLLLVL